MTIRHPWRGLEGLPRQVWTLCIATFINRSGTMVLPFLILYLTQNRGLSASRAGAALTVFGLGSLTGQPLAGKLADRLGAPRLLKASLCLSALLLLTISMLQGYAAILCGVFVWAIVSEAYRPVALAAIGDLVPSERRKSAYALNRLAVNLGMSFGPAIGGFLATLSFRWLFVVDAATSLVAFAVLAMTTWRVPATVHAAAADIDPHPHRSALADPRLVYFVFALFPVALVFFQPLGSMPLYLVRDLALPTTFFGLLMTLNTAIILLVEVPLNQSMASWPHRRALALGALLASAGFGALVWTHTALPVAATVVVWTFGEMILFPASAAYVAEIAPPGRRGEYMGLYSMVFGAAVTLGPWIGTTALEAFGPTILWPAAFAVGCLSVLLLSRLRS
jgi:MFS family permease